MAGRLGHIDGARRVGHVPVNGIRTTNYRYGFGGWLFDLDPKYGTDTVTDLAQITTWQDTIQGIIFSQATAGNKPRYIAADANFNNQPSIDFDTAARVLSSSYNGQAIGVKNGITIAFVVKMNTLQNANTLFGQFGTVGAGTLCMGGNGAAGLIGIGVYNQNSALMASTVEDTASHIVVITDTEINIDGTQVATGSWAKSVNWDTIGYDTTTTNRNFRGRLARLMIKDGPLTSSQCVDLYNRLNNDY